MEQATLFLGGRIRTYRGGPGEVSGGIARRAAVTENAIRKLASGGSKEPRFSAGLRIADALAARPEEFAAAGVATHDPAGALLPHVLLTVRDARAERVS